MSLFYGLEYSKRDLELVEVYLEELRLNGFTILPAVLTDEQIELYKSKTLAVYTIQENEIGRQELESIKETNVARSPLLYDDAFLDLIQNQQILNIANAFIGKYSYLILHLQNAIINYPQIKHHQTLWHRDLPYFHSIPSYPIALSALYCLEDFNALTGATFVLPYSHKQEEIPSLAYIEKNKYQITANKGDVILFDSLLLHCAGFNTSNKIRIGINHVFTSGLFKQQINYPKALELKAEHYSENLKQLLGFSAQVPENVGSYRLSKLNKHTN